MDNILFFVLGFVVARLILPARKHYIYQPDCECDPCISGQFYAIVQR